MTNFLENKMKLFKTKQAIQAIAVFIVSIFSNIYFLKIKNTKITISVFFVPKIRRRIFYE